MAKLEWCKNNAPEALKNESDSTLLSLMGSSYEKYCKGKPHVAYGLTLRQMCEQFENMWLYLDNVTYDEIGRISRADVIEAVPSSERGESMIRYMEKDSCDDILWANPREVNLY